MKLILKLTVLFSILLFSTSNLFAQKLTVKGVEQKSKKKVTLPVTLENTTFTNLHITFKVDKKLIRNVKVKPNQKFEKLNSKLSKNNNIYQIELKSDSPITINSSENIFDLILKPNEGFIDTKPINIQKIINDTNTKIEYTVDKSTAYKSVLFKEDVLIFGLLMLALGFVFYTSQKKEGFWGKFYKIFPALLMCYLIPAIFNSLGLISSDWNTIDGEGSARKLLTHKSQVYYVASRFLLPAALILMTLSINLKAIFNLGFKALAMFFTGTIGIVIGGPLAILIIGLFSPETVGGEGFDAVWRGLSTLAGSWIGGGANQTAMLEIFKYNQELYGGMVLVDIVVANIWMAILLLGIEKRQKIDKWLKADNSAIDALKEKVISYEKTVSKTPNLSDYMIMLGIAFFGIAIAHFGANNMSDFLNSFEIFSDKKSALSSFTSKFFWMISIATIIGVIASFTKMKKLEGAGASKIGSIFIYILVASIGMKMDLGSIFDNPGLIAIGLVWMAIHVGLLVLVAKLIRAPYFFLAVGSKANVGGAASAPVVAAAFHPSLATVGVLLAVLGYVIGTVGALLCAWLMENASMVV